MRRLNEVLEGYKAHTFEEKQDMTQIKADYAIHGAKLLDRKTENHVTVSSMILNPAGDAMLMVYHNIYDSYAWTGGHADGAEDLLRKAMEEAIEETGIRELWPISVVPLSVDVLPVIAHEKKGKQVAAHRHYNITYGMFADPKQKLTVKPDENSDVRWISLNGWQQQIKEQHMIPVYEKILKRMELWQAETDVIMEAIPSYSLPWFHRNGRDLPWRRDLTPYSVWLSEIMLQQTRVEAVKGYYYRFLETFPTIVDLAESSEDAVMKCWEGLGYYSRARNLQKAAREVMEQHNGEFPTDYQDVLALSGIGEYTAGAIMSVCYDAPRAAVDGNVLRVLSRVTEDHQRMDDPFMKKKITEKLEQFYPEKERFDHMTRWYNQSLMEIGALICLPNGAPKCEICPLEKLCRARNNGCVDALPRKKEKQQRKRIEKTVFLLHLTEDGGKTAMQKRPAKGLLAGLWQLPNVDEKLTAQQAMEQLAEWGLQPEGSVKEMHGKHVFTHLEWHMICYEINCRIDAPETAPDFHWKSREEMHNAVALPTAFKMFLSEDEEDMA